MNKRMNKTENKIKNPFIGFGKIGHFKDLCYEIKGTEYEDKIVKVSVSEKIHGTNGAVCFHQDRFWVQSRTRIINEDMDNAQCAQLIGKNKDKWLEIINKLKDTYDIDTDKFIISVYFEFCGAGIQKNSCVGGLRKMFWIFKHFRVTHMDSIDEGQWVSTVDKNGDTIKSEEHHIYNVGDVELPELVLDFKHKDKCNQQLIDYVKSIENESPIGSLFDKTSTCEGIVFTLNMPENQLLRCKIKGEKFHGTEISRKKHVEERDERVLKFVDGVLMSGVLQQMFNKVNGNPANDTLDGAKPEIKNIPNFIKELHRDVQNENQFKLSELGISYKRCGKLISSQAIEWYKDEVTKISLNGAKESEFEKITK